MQNQSTPSVLRDSDPLVGSVYGIYRSAVCVWVLKRIEKTDQNPVFFKIRIHWLAVCMASTGRLRFKVYRHWFTNRKPIELEVLIHFLNSEI